MKYNSKIILACDFDTENELMIFLNKMTNQKLFLKLGMQFLYHNGFDIILKLKNMGHNIFIDLKIYDIENTSIKAIKSLAKYKPDFITVHSLNDLKTLKKMSKEAFKYNIKLLGVTILTSLNNKDLKEIGINNNINTQILLLAKRLKIANFFGAISSANESPIIKNLGLISVTPGIRLENDDNNDQKRIVLPQQAFRLGADFIVIGRSIINNDNPLKIYKKIESQILYEK